MLCYVFCNKAFLILRPVVCPEMDKYIANAPRKRPVTAPSPILEAVLQEFAQPECSTNALFLKAETLFKGIFDYYSMFWGLFRV